MAEHYQDVHFDLDQVQENLLDCLPETNELPTNTVIADILYSEDLLLIDYDSHQKQDKGKAQIITEHQERHEYVSQGEEIEGHSKWLNEEYEANMGCWKIDQIKEVSEENTSLQDTEYRPVAPSQSNPTQIEFEVSQQHLGQISHTLQPPQYIIGGTKAQTEQTEQPKLQEIPQIGEEKINSLGEQAQTDYPVDNMPHVTDQTAINQPNQPQIAHEHHSIFESLPAHISNEQLQHIMGPYLQHPEQPIIDTLIEQTLATHQVDQNIHQNKEEPMQIEFIGFQRVTYQSVNQPEEERNQNKELPMEIESPMDIEQYKQPSICSQKWPIILQHHPQYQTYHKAPTNTLIEPIFVPEYQTYHKAPAHTLIEPILVPEVEPPMK